MLHAEHVERLMKQLGPLVDGIETIRHEAGSNFWMIGFEDGTAMSLHVDRFDDWATLSTQVGHPLPEHREKSLEMLLTLNTMWEQTDGLRFAFDADGGGVIQLYDINLDGLDVSRLVAIIEKQSAGARTLRSLLQTPSAAVPEEGLANALRV